MSDTESGREVTEGELLFCIFALAEFGSFSFSSNLRTNCFRIRRSDWWIFFIEWKIVKGKINLGEKEEAERENAVLGGMPIDLLRL